MKILFVMPKLPIGGVERVFLILLEQLMQIDIDCRLALRQRRGELVPQAAALVPIDEFAPNGIHQFVRGLARVLKRERPTHVITAFPDVGWLTWLAIRDAHSDAKWVHSAHSSHAWSGRRPGVLGLVRHWLDNRMAGFCYRHANAVVAVSNGVRNEIINDFISIDQNKVITIYNPAVPESELKPVERDLPCPNRPYKMVSIGRLVRQKAYDVLIAAMAHVSGNWQLDIWGDGPERELLQAIIKRHGLDNRVRLRGHTVTPFDIMRQADAFVLASRHEGLPNVLIEALTCQCQIVSANCPHGPVEILGDGRYGQLVAVENPVALAQAIQRVVTGEHFVAPALLLDRARAFSAERSVKQWINLLNRLS